MIIPYGPAPASGGPRWSVWPTACVVVVCLVAACTSVPGTKPNPKPTGPGPVHKMPIIKNLPTPYNLPGMPVSPAPGTVSFKLEVAPLFESRCTPCHTGVPDDSAVVPASTSAASPSAGPPPGECAIASPYPHRVVPSGAIVFGEMAMPAPPIFVDSATHKASYSWASKNMNSVIDAVSVLGGNGNMPLSAPPLSDAEIGMLARWQQECTPDN